jgi:hypothetical protein
MHTPENLAERQDTSLWNPSDEFDDPLNDDPVSPDYNPSGVVESADKLLRSRLRRP